MITEREKRLARALRQIAEYVDPAGVVKDVRPIREVLGPLRAELAELKAEAEASR